MLDKLIKYDLKWLLKIIVVFLGIGLSFSIIGRLIELLPKSLFFTILKDIFKGAGLSLIITGLFNCVIRSWVRFTLNIYKDESYLTHTLPVDKKSLLLSKVLSTLIVLTISIITLIISLFIMYYSKENMTMLKNALNILSSTLDISVIGFLLLVVLVILEEVVFIIFSGFLGIIIGYSFNNKKLLKAFLAGFIVYIVFSMASLLIIMFISLFSDGLYNIIFSQNQAVDFKLLKLMIIIAAIIYLIYNILLYFLMNKKLNKGVNLD